MKETTQEESESRAGGGVDGKVRFAVVGLGHFAQVAVLPAFKRAEKACTLAALVSSDPEKLETLGKRYGAERTCRYEDYDTLLASGEVDAVYVVLPNSLHCAYTVRALEAGVHVLVEKPMATTSAECERMIAAAVENDRACMVAYRLHFAPATLHTLDAVRRGDLGEPVFLDAVFSFRAQEGNIRLKKELGGGPLWDIGVYCINAARMLFAAEPEEVSCTRAPGPDARFAEVGATFACVLRFPRDRLATFTVSFAAAETNTLRIVGTKGDIRLEPAFGYAGDVTQTVTVEGDAREKRYPKHDQIAAELLYFAECVQEGKVPEPSGREGLGDVRVVEALLASAEAGHPVRLDAFHRHRRPGIQNEYRVPPHREPDAFKAQGPQAH